MGKRLRIKDSDFSEGAISPDYKRVNYVSSANDGQYFDLGIKRTANMKIEVVVTIPSSLYSTKGNHYIMGVDIANKIDRLGILWSVVTANSDARIYATSNDAGLYGIKPPSSIFDAKHKIAVSDSGMWLDDVQIAQKTPSAKDTYRDNNMYLMGMNRTNDDDAKHCYIKIHSAKVYDNGSVLMDLIPVKKKDGTVCILNTINGEYITTSDGTNPTYEG